MVRYEASVSIDAPVGDVWKVLSNVEQWPHWLPSVRSVNAQDGTGLRPGASFRVAQPDLPGVVWRATMVEPAYGFTWQSRSPGMRIVAEHLLAAQRDGATMVVLRLSFHGLLGKWLGRLTRATSERYLCLQACALKEAVELEHVAAA